MAWIDWKSSFTCFTESVWVFQVPFLSSSWFSFFFYYILLKWSIVFKEKYFILKFRKGCINSAKENLVSIEEGTYWV